MSAIGVRFSARGLGPADVAGRVVFVIDALRASATICSALHHGARAVIPAPSVEDALRYAETIGRADVVLAGERNCIRIDGFQLGNSPREPMPDVVAGKTVVLTTTNGTQALLACAHAAQVFVAAASNLTLAGERAAAARAAGQDLLIVCAGREGEFALEDAYTAGRLIELALGGRRTAKGMDDASIAALDLVMRYRTRFERPFRASRAGSSLVALGMKDDVLDAARVDAYPVLPQLHDRRITRAVG
jgi:2-phosphosulfolactate phosphatase